MAVISVSEPVLRSCCSIRFFLTQLTPDFITVLFRTCHKFPIKIVVIRFCIAPFTGHTRIDSGFYLHELDRQGIDRLHISEIKRSGRFEFVDIQLHFSIFDC